MLDQVVDDTADCDTVPTPVILPKDAPDATEGRTVDTCYSIINQTEEFIYDRYTYTPGVNPTACDTARHLA